MLFEFARANSCKSAYTDEISQVKFANRNDAVPMASAPDFRQYNYHFVSIGFSINLFIPIYLKIGKALIAQRAYSINKGRSPLEKKSQDKP
jgi:hypothetical protein